MCDARYFYQKNPKFPGGPRVDFCLCVLGQNTSQKNKGRGSEKNVGLLIPVRKAAGGGDWECVLMSSAAPNTTAF